MLLEQHKEVRMVNARILITLILVGMLGACASTPPATFNPNDSKALNIARAAGIDTKLKDVEVPKDTVNNITDSAGFGFAMAASGYNSPIPGFSPNQMAAMNFTAWLLAPEADSARNSMFAWIPEAEVKDKPIDYLADLLLDAASKAAKDMGYTPKQTIAKAGTDKSGIGVYLMNGDGSICKNKGDNSNCWIGFALRNPEKKSTSPSFLGSVGKNWFFNPSKNVYSRFVFLKNNEGLNELELLLNTSKHLPKWVYFYAAPNKIKFNSNESSKVPLIINQGKAHYFVKPRA